MIRRIGLRVHCVGIEAEDDTSEDSLTQFLQMQKNQLIDLREHFERWSNTLLVFGFNRARYGINLIEVTYYLFL